MYGGSLRCCVKVIRRGPAREATTFRGSPSGEFTPNEMGRPVTFSMNIEKAIERKFNRGLCQADERTGFHRHTKLGRAKGLWRGLSDQPPGDRRIPE